MHHAQQVARGRFPPLQRVEIEQLACCAPAGIGLEMTHWSTRSLARVAVERGIVPCVAHSTVSLILRSASLQPHPCSRTDSGTGRRRFSMRDFESGQPAFSGFTSELIGSKTGTRLRWLWTRSPAFRFSADAHPEG